MSTVTILMATYNGEKYIKKQINSIIHQTYTDWMLFIRDDGSTDQTVSIIKNFINQDERIHVDINPKKLGPNANFAELFRTHKDAEYIMFADQDDVWLDNKIKDTLEYIQKIEAQSLTSIPVLVYCKKRLVDANLKQINKREKNYEDSLKNILCQNHIGGNTMMLNNSLIRLINIIPNFAVNHDYWIALNAALFGCIYKIDKQLILYRQHNENVTGGLNQLGLRGKLRIRKKINDELHKTIDMNYKFCIDNLKNQIAFDYVNIFTQKNFRRLFAAIFWGIHRDTIRGTVRYYYILLNHNTEERFYDLKN